MKTPFGSSVRRKFGAPISGGRGDYVVYQDEPWKLSLRRYNDVVLNSMRRCRSVSPRRRSAKAKAAARRLAIQEILAKINNTQEDLQVLAENVANWSREAASLSDGIQEEALLLELCRQADKLAGDEMRNRELLKQERVSRLSVENSKLRNDLRDICRVCKLLLDVKSHDDSPSEAPAAHTTATVSQAYDTAAEAIINRYVQSVSSASGYSPSASATAQERVSSNGSGAATASGRSGRSCARVSYTPAPQQQHGKVLSYAPPFPLAVIATRSHGGSHSDGGSASTTHGLRSQSDEASEAVEAGLSVLTGGKEDAAAGMVAADEAPEGPVRSVLSSATGDGASPEEATLNPPRAATNSSRSRSRAEGGGRGTHSGNNSGHSGSVRSGTGAVNSAAIPAAAALDSSPRPANTPRRHQTGSFAGFVPLAADTTVQSTPALPTDWAHRPHSAQGAPPSASRQGEEPEGPAQWVPGPPIANPVITPVKQPEGYNALGPATPINKGRTYSSNYRYKDSKDSYGKDAVRRYPSVVAASVEPVTVRRSLPGAADASTLYKYGEPSYGDRHDAPSKQSGASSVIVTRNYDPDAGCAESEPLDSVLIMEVEKLKSINHTLESTLQAYHNVAERLGNASQGGAQRGPPSHASSVSRPVGTARALFPHPDEEDGPPAPVPCHSVAATYGGISATSTSTGDVYDTPRHGSAAFTSPPPQAPTTPSYHYAYQQPEEQQPSPPPSATEVSWAYARRARPDRDEYVVDSAVGGGDVRKDVRDLDTTLDDQLYDIRRQLQALRYDMVADRLTTLATSVTGGGAAGSQAGSYSGGSAALAAANHATAVAEAVLSSRATAAALPAFNSTEKVVQIARIEDEIAELRRQMRVDKDWYHDRLDTIISERSAMFRDLQRRMDRLLRRTE